MKQVCLRGAAVTFGLTLGLAAVPSVAYAQTSVACGDSAGLITVIQNAASGDTISLAKGCTYAFGSAFDGGGNALPPITKKLTIKGEGSALVRSNRGSLFRLLKVAQSGDLTLDGIEISAGHTGTDGGGIANEGKLTLVRSEVTGNTADQDGGGISNEGGTVTLRDSSVAGNTALSRAADDGGGLSNNNAGTLTLKHTSVIGNTADQDGGGIDNKGVLSIEDSTFSGNTARDDDGGAINNSGTGSVTVKGSKIVDNVAGLDGGAINNGEQAKLDIWDTDLSENISGNDGAAVNNEGTATLTKTEVTKNSAGRDGGGINNEAKGSPAHLTLNHSRVTDNVAARNGGGINNQTGASVTLNDSQVVRNRPNNCLPLITIAGCQN
ncbi:hypothetical protein [Streptomyces sp. TP-A0356]|uniref:hypothetical protein n=1 Tax=Streptomyces sp. TP-A0356 TaxID=1359208 RepID=UPI0006E1FE1D|nr:hypothetical protein [Streptomyces sp. TP-A0356]